MVIDLAARLRGPFTAFAVGRGRVGCLTRFGAAAGLAVALAAPYASTGAGADEAPGRTIVVGFDGMDPSLTEAWMAAGFLPNFAKLKRQGHYQPLPTTNPAQSPVAWSSFATGLNPGAHGIFDFLSRNPQTYGPDYSIASVTPARQLQMFGLQLPLDSGSIANRRVGTPFWVSAEREGRAELGAARAGHLSARPDHADAVRHGRAGSPGHAGHLHRLHDRRGFARDDRRPPDPGQAGRWPGRGRVRGAGGPVLGRAHTHVGAGGDRAARRRQGGCRLRRHGRRARARVPGATG